MRPRIPRFLRPLLPLCLAFLPFLASHARPSTLSVGVARVDISPTNAVRLMGYAARADTPAPTHVAQRLHARALALGEGSNAVVIVTLDNCILPGALASEIRAHVARVAGLDTNRIALTVTHTHSAPCLTGAAPNIFARDISPEDQAQIDLYTRGFVARVQDCILQALANRQPAAVAWGEGRVSFARNRRTPGGPVDHALPVLRITTPDGQPRAVLASYACHCTTLGGEFNASHGDWAGVAALDLESAAPGLTALVAIGCGADSNPAPRGTVQLAEQHGRALAAETRRLLALPLEPLTNAPSVRNTTLALPFQPHFTRQQWEQRAKADGIVGHHARRWLARLDRNEPPEPTLPYPVQSFAFGNQLAMVFLGGEVVVDYALRLKTELDPARLWINAYANDVPGYIPSRRILAEGGYEAESSLWYYDRPQQLAPATEDLIVDEVRRQLTPAFSPPPAKGEMTPPREARRALESFSLPASLTLDLVAGDDLVQSPVAIDFAPDGSLWVCEMFDYPAGLHGGFEPAGRLKRLTDSDRDGRFDSATVVARALPFPTGVMAWRDGALVCAAPDILWISGDGARREVLFTGFATHNYQARVNGLRAGLDGWVYGSGGLFGGRIRSTRTGVVTDATGRDFRFRPDTGEFQALPGIGQQGRVRDDFGEWFGNDNGSLAWHYPMPPDALAAGIEPPQSRVALNRDDNRVFPTSRTLARFNDPHTANHLTSACAPEIHRAPTLNPSLDGNLFVCEPVHNLVRSARLTPADVSFDARRTEPDTEFLASTDNWFRPVEIRTGPDGALWVVDMYRFVVEHPRWIPPDRLAGLDPRGGAERGRIYRIRNRTDRLAPLPRFPADDPVALAATLASDIGPARDIAQRLLLAWAGAGAPREQREAAITAVQRSLRKAAHPGARVQCAAVLHHLGGLDGEWPALLDSHDPRVARFALGLAGNSPGSLEALRPREPRFSTNAADRLHFALALHRIGAPAAPDLLRFWLGNPADPWTTAVVLHAATGAPEAIADAISGRIAASPSDLQPISPILDRLAHSGQADALSRILAATPGTVPDGIALAWIARAYAQAGFVQKLSEPARGRLLEWLPRLQPQAAAIARDSARNTTERLAALVVAGINARSNPAQARPLLDLLNDSLPAPFGPAVLEQVRQLSDPAIADALLASWPTLPPARRGERIELLLTRPDWTARLLDAVTRGIVAPAEFSATQRDSLRRHPRAGLRDTAARLFTIPANDRAAVLARYKEVGRLTGVAAEGFRHFERLCATCHALRGQGHPVGPDIAAYRSKDASDFVTAVLDPNAAIDARSVAYRVELADGRTLTGIVADESNSAFTVVQPGGLRERIERKYALRIEAAGGSLMPEGFEAELTPQALADLLAWLRKMPGAFGQANATTQAGSRRRWHESRPSPLVSPRSSNPSLGYPSWLGYLPLHFCRQTIGQDRMSWTAPAPAGTGPVVFRWPAAMGFLSQPAGHFTLHLASQPVLEFDVSLEDRDWTSADGSVRMRYRVEEANAEDSNGVLEIELDPARIPADRSVRFSIQASNSASQRWFGLYAHESP